MIDYVRFWSNVGPPDPTQPFVNGTYCRLWQKSCFPDGYGQFTLPRQGVYQTRVPAHRVAFASANGISFESLHDDVLHDCDNKPCCEPRHLHPGDDRMNKMEASERGLLPCGSRNGNSVLTEELVLMMRRLYRQGVSKAELGRRFGVSRGCAGFIINRKTWSHI